MVVSLGHCFRQLGQGVEEQPLTSVVADLRKRLGEEVVGMGCVVLRELVDWEEAAEACCEAMSGIEARCFRQEAVCDEGPGVAAVDSRPCLRPFTQLNAWTDGLMEGTYRLRYLRLSPDLSPLESLIWCFLGEADRENWLPE